MPELTLYHFVGCPYCAKVTTYMRQAGITLPMKDTHADPRNREELVRIGGKAQVPCLVINGKALYESDDIVDWLKKNWKK